MAENAFKADWPSFALGFNTGKSKGGGGVELNIAYGDTAPEDTTKLWVKTDEPTEVLISSEVEQTEVEGLYYGQHSAILPTKIAYAGCGVVGDKIYIVGGVTTSSKTSSSKSVIVYDINNNTFEVLENALGKGICAISCAVVGNRLYFAGGGSSTTSTSNLIRYFDTETKQLVTCTAQLPNALYGAGCGSIGNDVYIFGGSTTYKTAYKFDTTTETLTTIGSVGYSLHGAVVSRGVCLYVFGSSSDPTNCYIYDTVANSTSSFEIKRGSNWASHNSCSYGIIGDNIYAIGGSQAKYIHLIKPDNTYEELSLNLPDVLSNTVCASVGSKIYIFGGSDAGTNAINPLSTSHIFSENTPVPFIKAGSIYIKPQTEGNIFPIFETNGAKIEIGVDTVYEGNTEGIGEEVEAALYKDGEWVTI